MMYRGPDSGLYFLFAHDTPFSEVSEAMFMWDQGVSWTLGRASVQKCDAI